MDAPEGNKPTLTLRLLFHRLRIPACLRSSAPGSGFGRVLVIEARMLFNEICLVKEYRPSQLQIAKRVSYFARFDCAPALSFQLSSYIPLYFKCLYFFWQLARSLRCCKGRRSHEQR